MMPRPAFPLMHGGHIAAPLELEDRGQFQPCEVLQHDQDGLFIHPVFDVGVAFISRDHDQAVGFDLLPEGLVIHRLQPVFNVVDISEFTHEFRIAERTPPAQISAHPSVNEKETSHV